MVKHFKKLTVKQFLCRHNHFFFFFFLIPLLRSSPNFYRFFRAMGTLEQNRHSQTPTRLFAIIFYISSSSFLFFFFLLYSIGLKSALTIEILSKSRLEKCEKGSDSHQNLNCTRKIVLNLAVPSGSVIFQSLLIPKQNPNPFWFR